MTLSNNIAAKPALPKKIEDAQELILKQQEEINKLKESQIALSDANIRIAELFMDRSEEHTSELSHTVISYAVFCLKKKKQKNKKIKNI